MNGAGGTTDAGADPNRLARLRMRSNRRGTKEMDLILGRFAAARLDGFGAADLDLYEAVLEENDQDLYLWVTGARPSPAPLAPMLDLIANEVTRGTPVR